MQKSCTLLQSRNHKVLAQGVQNSQDYLNGLVGSLLPISQMRDFGGTSDLKGVGVCWLRVAIIGSAFPLVSKRLVSTIMRVGQRDAIGSCRLLDQSIWPRGGLNYLGSAGISAHRFPSVLL